MISNKRCSFASVVGAVLLSLIVGNVAFAQNTATGLLSFSNSTLAGSYVFTFNRPLFADGLGIFSFDGKGNVRGTINGGGPTCATSGSYTVNGDGSGSISLSPACINITMEGNIAGFSFVIADRFGNKIYASTLLGGDAAASATFTRRLAFSKFTVARLSGSYALLISGRTDAGLTAGEGILTSDGKGNASATINFQADDATCTGTTNGTYTVNPDGTGTFSFPNISSLCTVIGVIPIAFTTWNFVLDDAPGLQADLIFANTTSNILIVGKLSHE
jgi:hypothetical protein